MAAASFLFPQSRSKDLITRSTRPEDLEMPLSGFGDFITPIEHFFVRSHVTVPKVDLAQWRLNVDGHVATPLRLSMDDLRNMRSVELTGVLECAGNGRAHYDPPVPGVQWNTGAVGNGRWRGVRLADVLQRAGIKPGAVEILFDGADIPIGTMADFQRTIPVPKALHPDTLLVYSMNGEALPVQHGFPLRVVVPGWAGDSWVKWLTSARVLNEEFRGFWMKNAYLYPRQTIQPGAIVPPEEMVPVTSLRIKSVIAFPTADTPIEIGKRILVTGAAWSGDAGPVTAVDVSVDQGRTWKPASLEGKPTKYGWRLWEFPWIPSENRHDVVLARARDKGGNIQPAIPGWNPSGYLWNGIARIEPPSAPLRNLAAAPPANFRSTCVTCHDDDMIRQQRLTREQWDRELNKMTGWGARLLPEDRSRLLDYLTSR